MDEDPPNLLPLHDPASSEPAIATMPEEILKVIPCGNKVFPPESGFLYAPGPFKTNNTPHLNSGMGGKRTSKRIPYQARKPTTAGPVSSLGLIVNCGCDVSVADAQCTLLVRKHLPSIPTPGIYGWQRDERQTFIYMELVDGSTVEELWRDLNEQDRADIFANPSLLSSIILAVYSPTSAPQ